MKSDENILIDTGLLGFTIKSKIIEGLEKEGISVEQVDTIINTHLHHDHCGNNHLFRGRELLVHEKEILFARETYWPEYLDANIELLDVNLVTGSLQVAEDVRIIETPGHTPGSISVIVETDEGKTLIAGDTIQKKGQYYSHSHGLFCHDPVELAKSIELISGLPLKFIIPDHDCLFGT